jgi:mannonate dehydratase
MYVGTQVRARSEDDLRVLTQLGVEHICGWPDKPAKEWTTDYLNKYREHIESFGLKLDMLSLGLEASDISQAEYPGIMLGKSPNRDRELDHICNTVRIAATAGIPALKYNLTLLNVISSEPARGRGGSTNRAFTYSKAKQDPPMTIAGLVNADMMWERINYFVQRVIAVAQEYKVRMACHPHDPPMPHPQGFRGVDSVLGSVEGLKRFVELSPSKYHGLNFCQGTVAEMLRKPGEQIYDVIRYFGSHGRIFNVHLRNIRGGYLDFVETFPDEGDVDMYKAVQTYKDVGYQYMLMPDHVPTISGRDPQGVAFAFCYGYIKALLQAVNAANS